VNLLPQLGEPLQQAVGGVPLLFGLARQRFQPAPQLKVAEDQPDHDNREYLDKALHGVWEDLIRGRTQRTAGTARTKAFGP
jgi:hypothetical protein